MNKNFNYKAVFNLKMNNEKTKKRVITKILKLDENNQYGHGMTKPLPTGCIKDNDDISWETFNFLLENVSFEDAIGHLYIVDIEFDTKNATENLPIAKFIHQLLRNKELLIHMKDLYFNYQNNLLEMNMFRRLTDQQPRLMQTFSKKKFLPMYLEDLVFCIKGSGTAKAHANLF